MYLDLNSPLIFAMLSGQSKLKINVQQREGLKSLRNQTCPLYLYTDWESEDKSMRLFGIPEKASCDQTKTMKN